MTSTHCCLFSVVLACASPGNTQAQRQVAVDSVYGPSRISRSLLVASGSAILVGGALVGLDQAWYSQYERGPFRFFDDGAEWMGMDKAGHLFSAYTTAGWGNGLICWSGASRNTARWVGGTIGFTFLTGVEVLDGFSEGWGFSGWDMAANVAGTGSWIAQDIAWGEQRLHIKYSAHLTKFASQRPDLLGEGLAERLLKDYNGQTYWLSANLSSLFNGSRSHCTSWMNAAIGYGAEGMISARPVGSEDIGTSISPQWRRQWFLSFDLDLDRIPVRGKGWRTLLHVLNCVKIPAPAVEFSSDGVVRGHWLYF